MFLPNIKHGEFQWEGRQGKPKRYAVIPLDVHKGAAPEMAIKEILKLWGLCPPNLLLHIDSNLKSFDNFLEGNSGKELLESEDFQFFSADTVATTPPLASSDVPARGPLGPSDMVAQARATLQLKVNLLCEAVAHAVEQTESWLVSARNSSGMNHIDLVLDTALPKTGAKPVILVTDYLNRPGYKAIYPWVQKRLEDGAVLGTSVVKEVVMLPNIWSIKGSFWTARMDDAEGELKNIAENFSKLERSEYATYLDPAFFPAICGTHYLFFEGADQTMMKEDAADPMLESKFSTIGDLGYLFVGGGMKLSRHILDCYSLGMPAVLVKNTGGATHSAAIIHDLITTPRKRERANPLLLRQYGTALPVSQEDFDREMQQSDHQLASSILNGLNAEYNTTFFQFRDVLEILNHYKARPPLFAKTIRVVNPLRDTPAQLLSILSGCFGSTYTGCLELGGSDAADSIIISAWGKHYELDQTCRQHGMRASLLMAAVMLCNFCTTSLAVFIAYAKATAPLLESLQEGPYWKCMHYSVIVLPALGGFFMTITSRFQYAAKWGVYKFACAQVVREIYRFRMRVGPYSIRSTGGRADRSGQAVPESRPMVSRRARRYFTDAIDAILASADKTGLTDEARAVPERLSLASHVDRCVLPTRFLPKQRNDPMYQQLGDGRGLSSYTSMDIDLGMDVATSDVEADNYVTALSADTYLESRVKPLIKLYRNLAPKLARQQLYFEILVLFAATAGTVLSALSYSEWVPITVAFGSTVAAVTHFTGISARLSAVNNALRELESIVLTASGLGVVDQSLPAFKTMIVERCESAVLAEYAAWTAASTVSSAKSKEGDAEQEEAENGAAKNKDK